MPPAMTELSPDRWAAGDAYEAYMGRWSRVLARVFLDWLDPPNASHWLEVGCGTGALAAAICERYRPASLQACDPSQAFVDHARRNALDGCTFSVIGGPDTFPLREAGFDVVVSGLVLNFMPQPELALAAMRERTRPGGSVAAYVWDYAGGLEFLQHFWEEAIAVEPAAAELDESRRFELWQAQALAASFRSAGLVDVSTDVLEMVTDFADFDDYWRPFLGGSGPAPSYVASLDSAQRDALRTRLEERLVADEDGHIRLRARALAVRGVQPVRRVQSIP